MFVKKKLIEFNIKRELSLLVFALYCVCIFSQTLMPLYYFDEYGFEIFFPHFGLQYNFIPFFSIIEYINVELGNIQMGTEYLYFLRLNIWGNIFFFTPFGLLMPILWEKFEQLRTLLLFTLIVFVAKEILQHFIGMRTDIDDVILNVFGVLLGYLVFNVIYKKRKFT